VNKQIRLGLSFDDVLLVPQKSSVESRRDVNTSSLITKNVRINIPMISLNMATVTESKMAIAMAREGGIGIIHRFMPISEQAVEVRKVKRSTGRIIEDPVTLYEDTTLGDAIKIIESNNEITGLLVVDKENKLGGILTQRDLIFEKDINKPIKELMTKKENLVCAKPSISIDSAKNILKENKFEKLPLVDEEGYVKGLITMRDIIHLEKYNNACRDKKGRLKVAAAIGIVDDYLERASALVKEGVDVLVVDVAHGHSDMTLKAIRNLKKKYKVDILAGNVATGAGARDLIKAGVDGIKVGIGNGTICTTRIVAGAGVPQFTAILDVYSVAKKYGVPVISDGGIASSGNFAKALAVGASAVMFGSVFAGTDETPGPVVYKQGRQYKHYHGSTSYMSNVIKQKRETKEPVKEFLRDVYVEGIESMVPYKGPVREVIYAYMKGLKSGMSYCNAKNLVGLRNNSEFIRITDKGLKESMPHDVEEV
jgi:IMP dehydrogenase